MSSVPVSNVVAPTPSPSTSFLTASDNDPEGPILRERTTCRVCASKSLVLILDLHTQPLANAYLPEPAAKRAAVNDLRVRAFPLRLQVCDQCYHMQLSHVVRPDVLFSHYLYASGTNQTISKYFEHLAETIDGRVARGELTVARPGEKSILEIASNDATQLDCFTTKGWKTAGVDPAANLVASVLARPGGCPHRLVCAFWSREVAAQSFAGETFDVILAQNVFAHVDDCKEFILASAAVMHANSHLYIQTSQCRMIQRNEFDTIYHEHLSFFTVMSMKTMAEVCGLYLVDVTIADIHGDSFLFTLSKQNAPLPSVAREFEKERAEGLYKVSTYHEYARKCKDLVHNVKVALKEHRRQGFKLVGYGAAAKGMTFLNFAGITADDMEYIVDDAPLKQGLYAPGCDVPIVNSAKLANDPHTKLLIMPLAWNFFTEIRSRVERLLAGAMKQVVFIRYFPAVELNEVTHVPSREFTAVQASSERALALFSGCQVTRACFEDLRGKVVRVDAPSHHTSKTNANATVTPAQATQAAATDASATASTAAAASGILPASAHSSSFEQILVVSNESHVLRGMHYAAYQKTLIVLDGTISDVIVDLRAGSPTFGQWHMVVLDSRHGVASSLTIPAGFAHGYYSEGQSKLVYGICAHASDTDQEVRIDPFDPKLSIEWPFSANARALIKMNRADQNGLTLEAAIKLIRDTGRQCPV